MDTEGSRQQNQPTNRPTEYRCYISGGKSHMTQRVR